MELFKKAKGLAKDAQNAAQTQYRQYQQQQGHHQPQYPQQYGAPAQQDQQQFNHFPQSPNYQQKYYQAPQQQYQAPAQHYQQYAPPSQQHHDMPRSYPDFAAPANSYQQPQTQVTPMQQHHGLAPATPTESCLARGAALCAAVQFHIIRSDVLTQLNAEDIHYDGIAVCSACYSAKIAPHAHFAAAFTPRHAREQESPLPGFPVIDSDELRCSFSLPRVLATWLAECVPNASLQPLVQYYRHIMSMPACAGKEISTARNYWEARGGVLHDIGICDTCYEKYIVRTTFSSYFHQVQLPAQVGGFICDIGMDTFFFRVLTAELDTPAPDFSRLIARMQPRISAAPCPGENVALGQIFIHSANGDGSGIFCAECFYENISGTVLEKDFTEHLQLTPDMSGSACDLAGRFSKAAMGIAVKRGDDEIWRRSITLKSNSQVPLCVGVRGVDEEDLIGQQLAIPWHQARQFPMIEVCPMCYIMTAELYGAAGHFEPINRQLSPGLVRQCFLSHAADIPASNIDRAVLPNSLVWRGHLLRQALSHGLLMRDAAFAAFLATAAKVSEMPPPCGTDARALKPINRRRYLGRVAQAGVADDKTITWCAECHNIIMERAQGTPLEQELASSIVDLTADANSFSDGFVCNMQAASYKDALAEACIAGNWLQFTRWYVQAEAKREADKNHQAHLSQAGALLQMQQAAATQAASIHLMQSLNHNVNMTIMRI